MEKIIKLMADFTGIKEDVLKKALDDNDPKLIKLEGVKVYKDAEISEIKTNFEGVGLKKGKAEAETEIVDKAIKSNALEGTTATTIDAIIKETTKKALVDAKIAPDKKVSELQEQLSKVQGTIDQKDVEIGKLNGKLKTSSLDSIIFSKLPGKLPGGLTGIEAAGLLRAGIETIEENGKIYHTIGGSKELDNKGNPVEFETFIARKITERGWDKETETPPGGKGGNHKPGKKGSIASISDIKSTDDLEKYIEDNKIGNASEQMRITAKAMKNEGFKASGEE